MHAGLEMGVVWRHFGVSLPPASKFVHGSGRVSQPRSQMVSMKSPDLLLNGNNDSLS